MKRVIFLVGVVVFGLSACQKRSIKKIEKSIVEGTWRVSYFVEEGENKTSEFTDVIFTFNADGSVEVSKLQNVVGSWNTAKEDDDDSDGILDDKHIEFSLNLPAPYTSLSDDWEVESQSDDQLKLKDDSDDDSDDELIFQKI